jgi:hypothetical protein
VDSPQPDEARPATPAVRPDGTAVPDTVAAAGPALRPTDADRERTISLLQAAVADGRLPLGELETMLESVYTATSTAELSAIMAGLRPDPARWSGATPTSTKDVAVLSDFARGGRWLVGDTFRGTAVIGTGVIDLREARFTGPETTIIANSIISSIYIVVPRDVEVHIAGTGIIGGFERDAEYLGGPAAHRVNIAGVAVAGKVHVVHEPPAAKRGLRRRKRRGIGRGSA